MINYAFGPDSSWIKTGFGYSMKIFYNPHLTFEMMQKDQHIFNPHIYIYIYPFKLGLNLEVTSKSMLMNVIKWVDSEAIG